jgi:hypothetical protein
MEEGRRMNQRYIEAIANTEGARPASEPVVSQPEEQRQRDDDGTGADTKASPPAIDSDTKENEASSPSDHKMTVSEGSLPTNLNDVAGPEPECQPTEIPEKETADTDTPTGNNSDLSGTIAPPAPAHVRL